jgi:serpin B
VAFACGVWSDLSCPLKPGFREAVVDGAYRAEASTVDFRGDRNGACRMINAWVERATNGLIENILSPESVGPLTRVVLGNAMYFKGKWEQTFSKSATKNASFRRLGGAGTVDVPFMQSRKKQFIAVHDGFKVLQLWYKKPKGTTSITPTTPYAAPPSHNSTNNSSLGTTSVNNNGSSNGGQNFTSNYTHFSMCIFLPDADDGLPSLLDAIASRPGFLHGHLPRKQVRVGEFKLPRFKLSSHSSVISILRKLGLQLPFSPAADLSGIAEEGELLVNEVIQKAVIEVNEEGTEAVAVTCLFNRATSAAMRTPPVDFVADHPFAYFIVEEETGAVVFAGHVHDPSRE